MSNNHPAIIQLCFVVDGFDDSQQYLEYRCDKVMLPVFYYWKKKQESQNCILEVALVFYSSPPPHNQGEATWVIDWLQDENAIVSAIRQKSFRINSGYPLQRAMCEGVCASHETFMFQPRYPFSAVKKIMMIICSTEYHKIECSRCSLHDNIYEHVKRAAKDNILISIFSFQNHPSILAVWEASSPSALINDSDPSSCYSRANALVPHHLYEQGTSTNFQGCPVNHLINGGREVFMQTYLYLLRGMELNFPPPPSFSFSTSSATLMTPTSISLKSEIGSTDGMQYQSPAVKQENRDRMQAPACTLATNPRRTYSTNLADFRTDNLQTVGTMSDHHHQTISPSVPKFLVQPLKSSTLIKQPVTPSITPPSMWSASFVWSSCSLSNQLQEIVFYTALNQRIPSSIPKRLELMTIDKLKHLIDIRNLYLKIDLNFMNNQKAKFDLFLRDLYLVKYFGCHVLTYVLLVHFDNQKLWLSIFSIDSPNNNNTVESFSKQSLVQKSTNCTPVMNMNQVNTSNFNPAQRMLHSVQGKYTMGGYSGGNNASGYLAYVTALSPVVTTRNIQSELIPVSQNLISASIPAPPGIYLMLNSVSDSYSNTPMYQNSNTSNGAC